MRNNRLDLIPDGLSNYELAGEATHSELSSRVKLDSPSFFCITTLYNGRNMAKKKESFLACERILDLLTEDDIVRPSTFTGVVNYNYSRQIILRLVNSGKLVRIARGEYRKTGI